MYFVINIFGIIVFLVIGFFFFKNKKVINWKVIVIMVVFNLVLVWFLIGFVVGCVGVKVVVDGFVWIVDIFFIGMIFVFGGWYDVKNLNFICLVLMLILMIVLMFDILIYIGVLFWIIKWIGWGLFFIIG